MADPDLRKPPPAHPDYIVLSGSAAQRKALWARDGGRCARCKRVVAIWDAEHIHPLWLVDRSNWPQCLKYWTLDNLQTLCRSAACHPAKTALEAAARAKIKRIIKKSAAKVNEKINAKVQTAIKWIGRKPKAKKFVPRPARQI